MGSFSNGGSALSTLPGQNRFAKALRKAYEGWQGTRYRMGGNGKSGIDCSGLVRQLYASLFGMTIPRTTAEQVQVGRYVTRAQLRPGDLVFFRPPSYPRHVGVYVGNGEFVHASASKGVTLSRIDSDYWRRYYWTSRRIMSVSQRGEPALAQVWADG